MIVKIFLLSTFCLLLTWNTKVTAYEIGCGYKLGTSLGSSEQIYYCIVKDDDGFNGTQLTINKAYGHHPEQFGKGDKDVKGLLISSINVGQFPIFNKTFFGGITHLEIGNGSLKTISEVDLAQFPDLVLLSLPSNQIKSLPRNTFKNNPKLKVINLKNNQLNDIQPLVFDELKQLEILNLNGNKDCPSLFYADTEEKVQVLKKMIKSYNCTTTPVKSHMESLQEELSEQTRRINELMTWKSSISEIIDKLQTEIAELKKNYENLAIKNEKKEHNLKCSDLVTKIETILDYKFEIMNKNIEKLATKDDLKTSLDKNFEQRTVSNSFESTTESIVPLRPLVTYAPYPNYEN